MTFFAMRDAAGVAPFLAQLPPTAQSKVHDRAHPVLVEVHALDDEQRSRLAQRQEVAVAVPLHEELPRASRAVQSSDHVVSTGRLRVGGGAPVAVIAGPCSVDGPDTLLPLSERLASDGATGLRGGAYKPRTTPYAFQGMGEEGLALLAEARARSGLPVVTEVTDVRDVELAAEHADVLQVGARNMQNTALLKELGQVRRPVLLKRGFANTLDELLSAAEYVLAGGNDDVLLCERGIRTFENATRFTFDLGAIPWLKSRSRLPVLADPSHAAGERSLVIPIALGAVAAGADGLLVEVHPDPARALSDGHQALLPDDFTSLMRQVQALAAALPREARTEANAS